MAKVTCLLLMLPLASPLTSAAAVEEETKEVQLFQTFGLRILRAETNLHRTGPKRSSQPLLPSLYVQVNVLAKRPDGRDLGHEEYYGRTRTVARSGRPVFNESFSYVKGVSPGFVLGTDTAFRLHLYDNRSRSQERDLWLGSFEIHLGHESRNDRSGSELMNVMLRPGNVGSVLWYSYDFTLFHSTGGLWGSDVSFNWEAAGSPAAHASSPLAASDPLPPAAAGESDLESDYLS